MKHAKKLASLLLALVMVLSLGAAAFATSSTAGSITIKNNDNVHVADKTFNAYKILDVKTYTASSVVYTVPDALKDFYKARYTLKGDEGDFDAQVVANIAEETDLFAFAADALAAAKAAGIAPGTATAGSDATSVTIDNLPLGYYVVEDVGAEKPISALILDATNPSVEVAIKADMPTIDKKIDGNEDTDNSTTGLVENNNAAVGDKVPYVLTSKVPDMTGYKKYFFVVTDTLSKGLTFNKDVAITVGSKKLVKDTDFTVTATDNDDGTTSVEIVFKNFIQYKELKGEDDSVLAETGSVITITYSATVDEDAVIGVAGNPNKVILTYSNNPNAEANGDPTNSDKPTEESPVGKTPEKVTRTYVTAIELIKVDPQGNRLTGAEFKIEGTKLNTVLVRTDVYTESEDGTYWKLKDGSYTTDDPTSADMDQSKYESTDTKYTKSVQTSTIKKSENVTYTATVGADGVLRFEGLSAGTYTITEIKSPSGYNLLKDPVTVTIRWTAPTAPDTQCTWTYTGTDTEGEGENTVNTNHVTITNQSGTELPSTGGTGTTIFYVLGSILVLGAGVLLVVKKRMGTKD